MGGWGGEGGLYMQPISTPPLQPIARLLRATQSREALGFLIGDTTNHSSFTCSVYRTGISDLFFLFFFTRDEKDCKRQRVTGVQEARGERVLIRCEAI